MSLSKSRVSSRQERFPRVSGDEPDIAARLILYPAFSPRERG